MKVMHGPKVQRPRFFLTHETLELDSFVTARAAALLADPIL
jgi:hypothetical protein